MFTPISSFLLKNQKKLFLLLTIIVGIIILWPLHDFQPYLAQGDHGRDLYGYKKTFEGGLPYQDYYWNFGPLMPYYYSAFFKVFGLNIKSVLLGKNMLVEISGILFYLTISTAVTPFWAFIATFWFWTFDPGFFYTWNHVGGTALSLTLIYCVFRYIKTFAKKYVYFGFLSIFLLALVKLNFGVFFLLAFALSLWIIDSTYQNLNSSAKRLYLSLFFLTLLLIGIVYSLLLRGLPMYYICQCLPFSTTYDQMSLPLGTIFRECFDSAFLNTTSSMTDLFWAVIVIGSISQCFLLLRNHQIDRQEKKEILLMLTSLFLFFICSLHEFLRSGVLYRLSWAAPFKFLLMFVCTFWALRSLPRLLRGLLATALLFGLINGLLVNNINIEHLKTPSHFLSLKTAQVYTQNSPDWLKTVEKTTHYLTDHLKRDETFFAIPYEPLYYFLAQKDSPHRQFIFFEYFHIPEEQQKNVIAACERKRINYVILSNRYQSQEPGLGKFGETYCQFLAQYIEKNFTTVATFGDWKNEPGWAWNHGTKILKRINPL